MATANRSRRKPPPKVVKKIDDAPTPVVEKVQYPHVTVSVLHGDELGVVLEKVLAKMAELDKDGMYLVDGQERRMFITRLFKLPKNDWLPIIRKTVELRVVSGKGGVFPTLAIEEKGDEADAEETTE